MQLNQARDSLDGVIIKTQGAHTLLGDLRTYDVVVQKAHRAVGLKLTGGGLAAVVHERRKTQHEVGGGNVTVSVGFLSHRLLHYLQGMLVNVLVVVVFIDLELERGNLRKNKISQP